MHIAKKIPFFQFMNVNVHLTKSVIIFLRQEYLRIFFTIGEPSVNLMDLCRN